MKFALYTVNLSPHQVPLAEAIVDFIGEDEYRYVSAQPLKAERANMGWTTDENVRWHIKEWEQLREARNVLEIANVVMCGERDLDLMEYRCMRNFMTIYCSERWFKPKIGILRLLSPSYFKMAWRFVKLLRSSDYIYYFPIGIHAARDMARLCGLFAGDITCMFRAPKLDFEKKCGGLIRLKNKPSSKQNTRKYCLNKMRMWGYFVEPSRTDAIPVQEAGKTKPNEIKVLWVGRLLDCKRVDTIVRAVGEYANWKRVDDSLPKITLDIYGSGQEETRLKKLAAKYGDIIRFYPPVPISDVRKNMREHDIYVLASNAYEGWGAVVSEALEEGMKVLGTYEAGSSGTILPEENLFHAGDWRRMLKLLQAPIRDVDIGLWSAKEAFSYLQKMLLLKE